MKISHHAPSGTIGNAELAFLDLVGQEKVTNVNRTCAFGRALLTIIQQKDSGLVVLVKDVVLHGVSLGIHKGRGPQNHLGHVVPTNEFTVGAGTSV